MEKLTKTKKNAIFKNQFQNNDHVFMAAKALFIKSLYLKGHTITGEYYLSVMECLWKRYVPVRSEYIKAESWGFCYTTVMQSFTSALLHANF